MSTGTVATGDKSSLVWRESLVVLCLGGIAVLMLFRSTTASALHLWATSSAYNYGYLIAPIAAYITWHDRHHVSHLQPNPSWWGLAIAVAAAGLWLAADLIGIDEGRHFALVGMIQALLLGVLGPQIYRRMLFPCLYLFLMVPSGEFLVPSLQKLGHAGAVVLLNVTGIPNYAEGMFIDVPHGHILVEPGCSGLNFLLASLALSLLYAKLTYRRLRMRLLCVMIALVVSVVANILRIYLIIAINEWTNQQINILDDHLLYGWGFFALIMLATMWVGTRFEERDGKINAPPARDVAPQARRLGWAEVVAVGVLGVAAMPVALAALTGGEGAAEPMHVALPNAFAAWPVDPATNAWRPAFVPGDADALVSYDVNGHRVDVAVIAYRAQRDGREAAAIGNQPADEKGWQEIERRTIMTEIGDRPLRGTLATVRSGDVHRLVLAWYVSGNCVTSNRLVAKLCAARERLQGRVAPGAYFAMATDVTDSVDSARHVLNDVASALDVRAVMAADTGHKGEG